MAQEPAPGTGGDGALGVVTPDWVDDEDWALICAAHAAQSGLDLPTDG